MKNYSKIIIDNFFAAPTESQTTYIVLKQQCLFELHDSQFSEFILFKQICKICGSLMVVPIKETGDAYL